MKTHPDKPRGCGRVIHHGDLFDVLPTLEAESFDACVTDGPYGIGFMGKKWDSFKPGEEQKRIVSNSAIDSENPNLLGRTRGPASSPSAVEYDYSLRGLRGFQAFSEAWGREVLRVLKPGAYIVSCGAPRAHHRMMCGLEDAGFVVRDCFAWLFGQGFPKNYNLGDGKGTALKPAHEPIALAWKPFRGTISACHAEHGTAALNIDACRIAGDEDGSRNRPPSRIGGDYTYAQDEWTRNAIVERNDTTGLGRWPSNVLLDEEAAALLDAQTGELSGPGGPAKSGSASAWPGGAYQGRIYPGENGGASRFYYVAKPSREERDFGSHARNIHPTVKPIELMRWLVRLVTPPGGLVLDPFTGSGTTGMACGYEHRRFIGIEREAEYIAIAERRIAAVAPLFSSEHTV